MNGEIETLLRLYKERKIDKERFIAYAPAEIPKDTLSKLINDYDAGIVSDEEFISIIHGIMVRPPAVPPKVIDLLEQWDRFERTKYPDIIKRIDVHRAYTVPFLKFVTEKGIPATDVTESAVMEFIHDREREREIKYAAATIQGYRRYIKIFFGWLEGERVLDVNPLGRMKIKKLKGSPETFHIVVEHGKLLFSELNPIYEALYTHPDRFRDWRRVEIELRLLRETGLRGEHARLLQYGDINLKIKDFKGISCGGVISYSRIKPYERPPKLMPKIPTLISPLFANRLETYLELHPEIGLDEPIFYQRARGLQRKFIKLRVWAGVPYKVIPKKFRKAFATLLVNIEPKAAMWTQLTGDKVDTLMDYYADDTLAIEYEGMGLKGYGDIINIIFGAEGLLEEEIPPKSQVRRLGRQAFILPKYK